QIVLEIDLRWLFCGMPTKAGAAMVRQSFEIHAVRQRQHDIGLASTCHTTQYGKATFLYRLCDGFEQKATHGLIAAHDTRVSNTGLFKPGLRQLRAHAAAKAVHVPFRMRAGEICPSRHACFLDAARNETMAQGNRSILPLLLVARTNSFSLVVVDDWQVESLRERTFGKFDRCAHIQQSGATQEQFAVIVAIGTAHRTSTAYSCLGTSSPMGSSVRPSAAAAARNTASPSGSTATSKPPLVCGSHRRFSVSRSIVAMLRN